MSHHADNIYMKHAFKFGDMLRNIGRQYDIKITRFFDRNLIFDLFRAPSKAPFFESGSRSVPSLEL